MTRHWTHEGFHGATQLSVRVPDAYADEDDAPGAPVVIPISARVARRLNDAVCGNDNCECGEYVAWQDWSDHGTWYMRLPTEGGAA